MQEIDVLKNDDNQPFRSIEEADFYADLYYNKEVVISTNKGMKKCKGYKSNAWQPNGEYQYFFIEIYTQ